MKFYCYETETEFIYCVEGAEGKIYVNLQADPWWKKTDDDKFIKSYPTIDDGTACAWWKTEEKEIIKRNFAQFGQTILEEVFDWKNILPMLAQKFAENGIEWYIIGSVSEAVLGVDVNPHDMDIVVHTRDFYKARNTFYDYIYEPFSDNKGTWVVRFFGKLFLNGAMVDIVADEKMNRENCQHSYEKVSWNGYDVYIEPLQHRYEIELQRDRKERIKAIEEYMNCHK